MHGLIQAFSRTNRILNSIKTYGNIVCFRNLEENVNKAISIFGDKDASGIVVLKSFKEYYEGYDDFKGYKNLIGELTAKFPIGTEIIEIKTMKEFISLYNQILRVKNILTSFDDFEHLRILSDFDFQDYQSVYLAIRDKIIKVDPDKTSINDDVEFEIELIKSVEVNIDYILLLVTKNQGNNNEDKTIEITKAIDSSPSLRNKKDLILSFIKTLTVDDNVTDEWQTYIQNKKEEELDIIIEEENLNVYETKEFINEAFKTGEIKESGTSIVKVIKPMSMFDNNKGMSRSEKQSVILRLMDFFHRFFGL